MKRCAQWQKNGHHPRDCTRNGYLSIPADITKTELGYMCFATASWSIKLEQLTLFIVDTICNCIEHLILIVVQLSNILVVKGFGIGIEFGINFNRIF